MRKNTLEATNSRIMEGEDRISELEDRMVEINESQRKKEKRIKRNEDNLRDLQDNIKCSNIQIIGEKRQITHKGIPIRITADLSTETLQTRRVWQDILKVMKENNLQPRLLYSARISFKYEGEIKGFPDKQKLRESSTTKPALQQLLKDILQTGNTKRVYKPEPKTIK